MSTKIYVGGLNEETTEAELEGLFTKYGIVMNTAITTNNENAISKKIGLVEMQHAEEAQKAITVLNGKDFAERKLTVNQARPQQDRGSGRTAYQSNSISYR